jgi:chloride channel protein, CIC family
MEQRLLEGDTMKTSSKTSRVRDIMTTEVITLSASTSVTDAARSLTFHHVSGVPVIDGGRIVGVVSKSDLVDPRHRPPATVRDAMSPVVYAVRPGDPTMMAVRLMVRENVHRAVVVDERGKLAGMVSAMDVIRALARGDHVQDDDAAFQESKERHAATESERQPEIVAEYVDLTSFEVSEGE